MREEIVYLKLEQNSQVVNKKILLRDAGEIYTRNTALKKELENLVLYTVSGQKNENLIFSSVKVIEMIEKRHPGICVENIGEVDFIIEYKMPQKEKVILEWVKSILLFAIVFFGAAFAIMTFNEDVSVPETFERIYRLVMGTKEKQGNLLEISYSVGIGAGVLAFYNHFSRREQRLDPTPVRIGMRLYEEEINKALIKDASRKNQIIK